MRSFLLNVCAKRFWGWWRLACEYLGQRGLRVLSDLGPAEMTQRYRITSRWDIHGPLPAYLRIVHVAAK